MNNTDFDQSQLSQLQRICIAGLGLIGGSLAAGLKQSGFQGEIVAWGRREQSLKKGIELGIIDRFSTNLEEAVRDTDIVVVATPTVIAERILIELLDLLPETTVITDVASVKGNLQRAVEAACKNSPRNLVLGHPIAGSEQSGVTAAKAELFQHHRVILTPTGDTDSAALALVTAMWQSVGAEVSGMTVAEHDRVLAATSHLPHVLAFALVDMLIAQPCSADIFRFAAGGFRDFSRIASSDPTMWQEISLANREAIVAMIDDFSQHLDSLRQAIANENKEQLLTTYTRAKQERDRFADELQQRRSGDKK